MYPVLGGSSRPYRIPMNSQQIGIWTSVIIRLLCIVSYLCPLIVCINRVDVFDPPFGLCSLTLCHVDSSYLDRKVVPDLFRVFCLFSSVLNSPTMGMLLVFYAQEDRRRYRRCKKYESLTHGTSFPLWDSEPAPCSGFFFWPGFCWWQQTTSCRLMMVDQFIVHISRYRALLKIGDFCHYVGDNEIYKKGPIHPNAAR